MTPPLTPLYAGPYEVLEPGEKTFLIRIGNREDRVSVDRLKPHLGKEPVQPAAPRRLGRPKNVPKPPVSRRLPHTRKSPLVGAPLKQSCNVVVISKILQIYCQ